jgi:hypothetical protein
MSGTAKKAFTSDFWSIQTAYIAANEVKKDFSSVIKEALLDPFSNESLEQFRIIEALLIETHYSPSFSKEEENNLFTTLLEKLKNTRPYSLTIIKRNWSQVLIKRKILPKECFKKGKFLSTIYKKHLFRELSNKLNSTTSILSTCYHFAQELQAVTAILCGEFCDLESTTLEFLTFVEHINRQFKYPALLIHDPSILQAVLQVLHHMPNLSTFQLEQLLTDCALNAFNHEPKVIVSSILSSIANHSMIHQKLPLLERLDLISLISFFNHFEELLRIFKGREQKIVELCQHYQNSLQQGALFFENETFHEIPIIINTLFSTLKENESSQFINEEIHHLIWAYKENPKFLILFLKSRQTSFAMQPSPFLAFLPYGIQSIKDLSFIIDTFFAFKALSCKKDWKKMVKALSCERHLCIFRIKIEQINMPIIKEMKNHFLDTKSAKESLVDYLNALSSKTAAYDYLDTFYPLLG